MPTISPAGCKANIHCCSAARTIAERTATRDRPAGCSTCASSLCGAVCGNGSVAGSRRRWFVGAADSLPSRAREVLMIAGAGGAMRARGRRATAIRFQQFGEGALMASLAERTATRDRPAGCSTCASSLCGAVCGNGSVAGSRRRWFVGADRMAARIRRRAGDDGPKAPRRDQHDTCRHSATSVSF